MSSIPDYELEDLRIVGSRVELRALADGLRDLLLELMLERAATVKELAAAVGKAKSTVAYHVGVLHDAGLIKVVRTRQVRAIEERFYGRTARVFYISGVLSAEQVGDVADLNDIAVAARESLPAQQDDDLRAILRHARISRPHVREFWKRVLDLAAEFSQLPRQGEQTYGFVAGLYPTEFPTLAAPAGGDEQHEAR